MKFIHILRCINAAGARSRSNPSMALETGQEYGLLADVRDAETAERSGASGYLIVNLTTGQVLPRLYKRNRFQIVAAPAAPAAAAAPEMPVQFAEQPAATEANVSVDAALAKGSTIVDFELVLGDAVKYVGPKSELLSANVYYTVHMVLNRATTTEGEVSGLVLIDEDTDEVMPGVFDASMFAHA